MSDPSRLVSVVIPVHCEEMLLPGVLDEVDAVLRDAGEDYEILVVDDGSTDGTWRLLEKLCKRRPTLGAIRLSRRFGKESAVSAGIDAARGDAVIVMDGDGQHPPSLIMELIEHWRAGAAEIVEGVKREPGDESRAKRLGAALFRAIASRLLGVDLRNATDFKLLDRRVVDEWRSMGERNLFFRGMVAWLGFRRVAVPFSVADRAGGESRWTLYNLVNLALTAVTAYSTVPLRIVTICGALFLIASVLMAAQVLQLWARGEAVSGFATVILLLLIIGSVVLVGLGVIGEYVARIYQEVKARPRYVSAQRCGVLDQHGRGKPGGIEP